MELLHGGALAHLHLSATAATPVAEDAKCCPTQKDLQTIRVFGVWAEGVEGALQHDVQTIGAE